MCVRYWMAGWGCCCVTGSQWLPPADCLRVSHDKSRRVTACGQLWSAGCKQEANIALSRITSYHHHMPQPSFPPFPLEITSCLLGVMLWRVTECELHTLLLSRPQSGTAQIRPKRPHGLLSVVWKDEQWFEVIFEWRCSLGHTGGWCQHIYSNIILIYWQAS